MMPIDESVAHLQLVVGVGIVLREPDREQPTPMQNGAAERMCAELDGCGRHDEAARHRRELQVLRAIAQRLASGDAGAEQS